MKHKTMLLAVTVAAALAFAALPAFASAFVTTPNLNAPGGFPLPFVSNSGAGELLAEELPPVECETDTNAGEFENGMTGTVTVTFHGCKVLKTLPCTTAGQPEGTIQTEELAFHLVYLKPANPNNPHEAPGILFTPGQNGVFAKFSCAGIVNIEVKGNGVLGTITEPGIGVPSATSTMTVDATAEGQEHTETVEGEEYGLESSTGGAFVPAFENAGTDTVTFPEEVTLETE